MRIDNESLDDDSDMKAAAKEEKREAVNKKKSKKQKARKKEKKKIAMQENRESKARERLNGGTNVQMNEIAKSQVSVQARLSEKIATMDGVVSFCRRLMFIQVVYLCFYMF